MKPSFKKKVEKEKNKIMASNQLIKVTRRQPAKPVTTDRLSEMEKTLDKIWSMFQTQVERNIELMAIIQKQQENSHNITFSLPEPEPIPQKQITESPQPQLPLPVTHDIPELGFEKLKRLENVLGSLVYVRKDAMHSMINVFHYLYQYGGEAYPEQLIALSGISTATFYRYLNRMRESHIIMMKRGKAVMTETARKIYTEELKPGMDLDKAMYKEKFHRDPPENYFENPAQYWKDLHNNKKENNNISQ